MAKRKRRSKTAILAERTIIDIKRKEREFLKEVSRILSDALGFPVRVSHVKVNEPRPGRETTASRRPAAQVNADLKRQIAEAYAPYQGEGDVQ